MLMLDAKYFVLKLHKNTIFASFAISYVLPSFKLLTQNSIRGNLGKKCHLIPNQYILRKYLIHEFFWKLLAILVFLTKFENLHVTLKIF